MKISQPTRSLPSTFNLHPSTAAAVLGTLLLAGCAGECPRGVITSGKSVKVTLPGGGAAYVTNIDLGAIADETTYNKVSEKVADLTQLMSLCCEKKVSAQRQGDQGGYAYWAAAERKCFDQFLALQNAVKPKSRATPTHEATLRRSSPNTQQAYTASPARTNSQPAASNAALRSWFRHSAAVERSIAH
jgi:hypothetical protein